jgi:transposase
MSRYVEGENRNQINLEPLCLDEMIGEENAVRSIELIVESMKIMEMGFVYSEPKETGRKPYNPVDMFKLYAYSYFNGIRSSRKIERECHRNIEVMWLLGELKPDHKTIANFRKDNKVAIKAAFRRFTLICDELNLISKEIVGVDGSKFRASNGRMRYHSKGKISEKMKHYQESAEKYMNLLEQCDAGEKENQPSQHSRRELTEKLVKIHKRVEELERISEVVEAEGTIYLTDPDSRLMKTHNGGGDISHNVQIAVEAENHFIVAVDVTSDAVDYGQLHNIASQAKEELDVEELTAIADRGYYSGAEFKKCIDDGIQVIAPRADKGGSQAKGYRKGYFEYDRESEAYICPQGQKLSQPKQRKANRKGDRYYNKSACANCPAKEHCSPKTPYRTIVRDEYDDYAEAVDRYTKEHSDIFAKRKELVEHPFGTVKRAFGFSYFLTRGTENVRAESLLHFLAYNMKRLINIMQTPLKLAEALRARQEQDWVMLTFSPLFLQKIKIRRVMTYFFTAA